MLVKDHSLSGLLLIEPAVHKDSRGYFQEMYQVEKYRAAGITAEFVQDNRSFSKAGVVRGLHFQNPIPQAKLVSVSSGAIYDVAVDVRRGSPTFGQWIGETLTAENGHQLFIPIGFAHGFMALEDSVVSYKVSGPYNPAGECSVHWQCPTINIKWPDREVIISDKDEKALNLNEIDDQRLMF